MPHLRSSLYLLGQMISAILVAIIACLCFFLPAPQRTNIITQWARFNIWSLRVLCGLRYRVHGAANIPTAAAVILANHQSAWETLALQLIFPMQSYVLKKELLWIPFFGWGLALNQPIAIHRGQKTRALATLIHDGLARLNAGRWVVIFPEGQRMPPSRLGRFQAGGAMIATHAGCAVVPVAHNAGLFWPKNSFIKHPGCIDLVIGQPITTTNQNPRTINTQVEQWITTTVAKLPQQRSQD